MDPVEPSPRAYTATALGDRFKYIIFYKWGFVMPKKYSWIRSNQGIGILLVVSFIGMFLYFEFADWAEHVARDGFSIGFFPKVATALVIFFSFVMTVDSKRKEVIENVAQLSFSTLIYSVAITAYCTLAYFLMVRLGYCIVVPIFTFSLTYVLGLKSIVRSLLVGFIISGLIYGLFTALGVNLPSGILPF